LGIRGMRMGSEEGSTMRNFIVCIIIIRVIKPKGRYRRRWEDTIIMDLKEIGINTSNWVDSTQDRDYWRALVNACIESPGSISHGVSH
jgi:hypothetical protein